ncbi:hypothetical protein SDRG_10504 [Saprolegnia diclina VS20]|uniref:Uncharacterized protein n=1 Tax=Saprolegnia diclina (strain VS20) TaxID=1156394 RepID=T0QAK4_SAPDV|nr:hypothetical protein SDRG_10504 [Saprolegnia diclina VS20]EQC31711.1 hypothetical protein SDRG_10504 [Saprolegnia diclina VS20]|eukprot:XP_008614718.1 hypothetical protein SDRG_10504 [Saprolegnia diclina VS20]
MLYELLTKLPKTQAIGVSIAGCFACSYAVFGSLRYSGEDFGGAAPGEPKTTSAEWKEATKAYAAHQKMEPITHFRQ